MSSDRPAPPLARRARGFRRSLMRRILAEAPEGAVNLAIGMPDFPVAEPLQQAAAAALGSAPYTANAGRADLRELLADRMDGDPERIIVTCGSAEAVAVWTLAAIEAGGVVLVPDPGYPAYAPLARLVGASTEPYVLHAARGRQPDGEALAARIAAGDVAGLIINSPSNPCSVTHPPEVFAPALEACRAASVPVLCDEAYAELVFDGPYRCPTLGYGDIATRCGSLSKSHNAMGWRLGWMEVPEPWVESALGVHQFLTTCAPIAFQAAAVAALSGAADDENRRNLEILRNRRERLVHRIRSMPGWNLEVLPDAGFYLFVDVSELCGEDDEGFCRTLAAEAGVVLAPGIGFGPGGRGHVRISYAVADELLDEALHRLQSYGERPA